MLQIRLTHKARLDLIEIWLYIAQSNTKAADGLLDLINQELHLIVKSPSIGLKRNELAKDLRSFPFKKYVIFYRSGKNGIEIIRILHSAQDVSGLLW